ncbi:fimbrial protein [Escherichia coli]
MKKNLNFLLFLVSITPIVVFAWSNPGQDFNGELTIGGAVTNTRNPWVWKLSEGDGNLDIHTSQAVRDKGKRQILTVNLPGKNILLGKTILTSPAGREGLTPRISFGTMGDDFSLLWSVEGTALITLPVTGDSNIKKGTFSFKMIAGGVLCHVVNSNHVCNSLYDDINSNGLPPQRYMIRPDRTISILNSIFSSDAPVWLNKIEASTGMGLSRYGDPNLHQIDGAYGAQVVAGSGILKIDGELPSSWRVSLPVNIEYQ